MKLLVANIRSEFCGDHMETSNAADRIQTFVMPGFTMMYAMTRLQRSSGDHIKVMIIPSGIPFQVLAVIELIQDCLKKWKMFCLKCIQKYY